MKILLTGATGFVGSKLVKSLQKADHEVVVLTRNKQKAIDKLGNISAFEWSDISKAAPGEAFQNVDGIIHLMGENIGDGRWSEGKKKRIEFSREVGSKNLIEGLKKSGQKINFFISTSAVGIYGPRDGSEVLNESSSLGNDFLSNVCKKWESVVRDSLDESIRLTILRVGVVFGKGGGALAKMELPFKLGGGGVLGSGKQVMSWIHIEDLVRLYQFCAENDLVNGVLNATSPGAVTNKEFTKTMGTALNRPTIIPLPSFMAKIIFGEMATIVLDGQRVVPTRAKEYSFDFKFGKLIDALKNIF